MMRIPRQTRTDGLLRDQAQRLYVAETTCFRNVKAMTPQINAVGCLDYVLDTKQNGRGPCEVCRLLAWPSPLPRPTSLSPDSLLSPPFSVLTPPRCSSVSGESPPVAAPAFSRNSRLCSAAHKTPRIPPTSAGSALSPTACQTPWKLKGFYLICRLFS